MPQKYLKKDLMIPKMHLQSQLFYCLYRFHRERLKIKQGEGARIIAFYDHFVDSSVAPQIMMMMMMMFESKNLWDFN